MQVFIHCCQGNGQGEAEIHPRYCGVPVWGRWPGRRSHGVLQPDTLRLSSVCAVLAGMEHSTPASGGRLVMKILLEIFVFDLGKVKNQKA